MKNTVLFFLPFGILLSGNPLWGQDYETWPEFVGLDSWFNTVPVERSSDITNIGFTGKYANYTDADTWYPSWAEDGIMYSPWTDGTIGEEKCISWSREDAHTGQARILGNDPMNLKVESLGITKGSALPYQGRYPCGSLV